MQFHNARRKEKEGSKRALEILNPSWFLFFGADKTLEEAVAKAENNSEVGLRLEGRGKREKMLAVVVKCKFELLQRSPKKK